ncbi:MAG: hypothetical protein ACYC4R_15660 [Anaerolineae bacterium]
MTMLNEDGTFSFHAELMATIDAFVAEYEAVKGPFRNDLERGLVISYMLGVMRCDLETIWDAMGSWPMFGNLPPRAVVEDCICGEGTSAGDRIEQVTEMFRQRGWLNTEGE